MVADLSCSFFSFPLFASAKNKDISFAEEFVIARLLSMFNHID